ncbi:hypothetical protein QBC47DRAFT_292123 [Echria macrotheca]|uniref:RRM domain-containing protein n=1 Tax=Echria macrotheca TaxID=438768 RepID=A0AAJ0BJL2_9PEZI|nr:hypothetical protein QBC47DRAFT_292123 [Echria macrotheca]
MYRTASGNTPSEGGNGRHNNYSAYLATPQVNPANQHEGMAHGQHIGHGNDALGAVMNQFNSLALPTGSGMAQGANLASVPAHHAYCAPQDQALAYPGYHLPVVGMTPEAAYSFSLSSQFPIQGGYAQVPIPYQSVPYTPGRVAPYTDRYPERFIERSSSSDVPGLENRRGSYSTNESTPATPFFGSASERAAGVRSGVVPSTYTTPSPEQVAVPAPASKPQVLDEEFLALLKQDPAIPEAVPAVFTPPTHIKTIEQCLENRIAGNRNVYIRGLHPTTDDELLLKYASRFGEVEQSKAIIDTATGACKGFGFAKFADVRDSEKCIRGFYQLGYEVGFARESFNARLKAEGDETSTNLYLSNLPKNLNEAELNAIFMNYNVVSSKILRDSMGNSRGVGFARFESREECEDIIKKFHGACIGEEGLMMQVRYADTPAQKELKRITAERRQFRTNEYNIGAYGTADVGIHPSIYQQGTWNRRAAAAAIPAFAGRPFGGRGGVEYSVIMATNRFHRQSTTVSVAAPSEDGSADGGATVVDPPTVANGSTQSSPTIKKERLEKL